MPVELGLKLMSIDMGASPKELQGQSMAALSAITTTKGQPTIIGLGPHPDAVRRQQKPGRVYRAMPSPELCDGLRDLRTIPF